jgi:hypothetical protein
MVFRGVVASILSILKKLTKEGEIGFNERNMEKIGF